jgi:hypothetical protein
MRCTHQAGNIVSLDTDLMLTQKGAEETAGSTTAAWFLLLHGRLFRSTFGLRVALLRLLQNAMLCDQKVSTQVFKHTFPTLCVLTQKTPYACIAALQPHDARSDGQCDRE